MAALTGGESVVVAAWPAADARCADPAAEAEIAALQELVTEVRRFRSDQGLKPGQKVAARLSLAGTALAAHEAAIRVAAAARPSRRRRSRATARSPWPASTVEIDTAGTIDVAAERKRLEKDLAAARKEAAQARRSSATSSSWPRRPRTSWPRSRARPARPTADIARLEAQLAALPALAVALSAARLGEGERAS